MHSVVLLLFVYFIVIKTIIFHLVLVTLFIFVFILFTNFLRMVGQIDFVLSSSVEVFVKIQVDFVRLDLKVSEL